MSVNKYSTLGNHDQSMEESDYFKKFEKTAGHEKVTVEEGTSYEAGLVAIDQMNSANAYNIFRNQSDIEGGEDSWFSAGSSNNSLNATDDVEAQQALNQGGSSDALISNPNVDGSKTYTLDQSMGAVDMSELSPDEDLQIDYTASDLYYSSTGEQKQGDAVAETRNVKKTGKGEDGSNSQKTSYEMQAKDRWLVEANSGNNADYYLDENNKIRARKNQVNLSGYDGGIIGTSNSGIR